MNRLSTGRFVPPPVYIGFPLFVHAKSRSEQLFMVPWRARGTVGFRADRTVGTLFCPASPIPLSAVRRADRTRPLCVRVLDSTGLKASIDDVNQRFESLNVKIDYRHHQRSPRRIQPVESKTRTHNGRVGSAPRTADGGAGRSWAEQGADMSVGPEGNRPSSRPGFRKQMF